MRTNRVDAAGAPRRRGGRLLGAAMVAALVLGLHAGLFGLMAGPRAPTVAAGARPVTVSVRELASVSPVSTPADRPAAPRRQETSRRPPAPSPVPSPTEATPRPPPPQPTYATRVPESIELDFELRRRGQSGTARLQGQWRDGRYELRLDAHVDDRPLLQWHSTGTVDEHGLAPERFTMRRGRRPLQAVNFERDHGRIRFSSTTAAWPLAPGAQDRLSWWWQLPAILEAEPALRAGGSRIGLFVVGAHGDGGRWDFEVAGVEPLASAGGEAIDALHLLRRPQRPYDTLIELWLDPAAQHLPARIRLSTPDSGESLEFLRR